MIKVGLTGGIGSGKSTVSKILASFGVPIYYTDLESKRLLDNDPKVIAQVKMLFGDSVYVDGVANRKIMSDQVFKDKALLSKLEKVLHPAVNNDFLSWCDQNSDVKYVVQEAAILFESGAFSNMDYIVTISSPTELRVDRTMLRDAVTIEKVIMRMSAQMSDKQRECKADSVIYNDEQHLLVPQVIELHELLLTM